MCAWGSVVQGSDAKRRLLRDLRHQVPDERVLAAMAEVPRERFMPPALADRAYDDEAFPIGFEQTISQPTMVALMLEALAPRDEDRVLDVGTGSGYLAALLSHMAAHVDSVEIIADLASVARERFHELGYANIDVHLAGSELGWPASAPYDCIVVAAAAPSVPQSLIGQLGSRGRLVIPVGTPFEQRLAIVSKLGDGIEVRWGGACRFVPLVGSDGWSDPNDAADDAAASV